MDSDYWTRRKLLGFASSAWGLSHLACGRRRTPRYSGYALVANRSSRNIAVIDLSRFARLDAIPLDFEPSFVLADEKRGRGYVLGTGHDGIWPIDLDSLRLGRRCPAGGKVVNARLDDTSGRLWVVTAEPNLLCAYDPESGRIRTRIPLRSAASDLDVNSGRVAVALPQTRSFSIYDPTTGKLQRGPVLATAPEMIRFRPDGRILLATHGASQSMSAIDATTAQPIVELPLSITPKHMCFNADGGQLFVSGEGMDAVVIVSPYQTEVSETILAGHDPASMAATTTTPQFLFVANPPSGDVTVINIGNRRVVAQIPVGEQPSSIHLTPDNQYALVLNRKSGDVAVIKVVNIVEANLTSRRARTAPLFTMVPVGLDPVSAAIFPRPA